MLFKGAKIARLGSARLGSARLGSSIAPFIQCVKPYYIKLSCKIRKQGELCPVFGFFSFVGRGIAAETLRLNVRCCGCFNLFYRYTYCGNNF